ETARATLGAQGSALAAVKKELDESKRMFDLVCAEPARVAAKNIHDKLSERELELEELRKKLDRVVWGDPSAIAAARAESQRTESEERAAQAEKRLGAA